jgi:hypothetical protein
VQMGFKVNHVMATVVKTVNFILASDINHPELYNYWRKHKVKMLILFVVMNVGVF